MIINYIKYFCNIGINWRNQEWNLNLLIGMILSIDVTNDMQMFKNSYNYFDLINGNLVFNDIAITFLNCQSAGGNYSGLSKIDNADINYRVDRILLGKKLTKKEFENIYKYEVSFDDIDCFTDNRFCDMDIKTLSYKATPTSYIINTNQLKQI